MTRSRGHAVQRRGVVEGYVVVAALEGDPVFNREAREAGRVLARRFDAKGRTLVLASDEGSDTANGAATPDGLAHVLGSVAAVMNRDEDVLILYTTSHGSPHAGLNYRDPARGIAVISPSQLAAMLDQAGSEPPDLPAGLLRRDSSSPRWPGRAP